MDKPADVTRTSIERGAKMKGRLASEHPIVVRGAVDGEVTGPAVEVTETGVIAGKIRATELRSRGEIGGEITADDMELSGQVRDGSVLRAKRLEIRAGATGVTFGTCQIEAGDAPDKAAVIAAVSATNRPATPPPLPPQAAAPSTGVPEEIPAEKTDSVNKNARKPPRDRPAQVR
jgi:cytoskeletal protein CcmA (bactofilin family)